MARASNQQTATTPAADMKCPFLKETQARYCQASPYKKMIARTGGDSRDEKCLSGKYVHCTAAGLQTETTPAQPACPFLHESLVQFCAAASVTKFIPYSESVESRCGTGNHQYCELYLALANPPAEVSGIAGAKDNDLGEPEPQIEEIPVPGRLCYSANHMWLSISDEGQCHIGVDAFLARVIGRADRLSIVTSKGLNHPAAVLTIQGTDLPIVFPNKMLITGTNNYLRANPQKLMSSPYDMGWLFEGLEPEPSSCGDIRDGLIRGEEAAAWMQGEVLRMTRFVHDHLLRTPQSVGPVMMDGGSFSRGMAAHMGREELLFLFSEFFPFYASWRRSQ